jgi:NAD(P)-dependent dehydrogenase (short-subunit alcohol dehydrogenase family)
MERLVSARILIVGGSSGIGLATAEAALRAGAMVTIASRSTAKLDEATRAFPALTSVEMDVGRDESVKAALAGGPDWDHVVVSAGGVRPGLVRLRPLEEAIASINVKFWGAYRVAAFAPIREGGSLTFVSGVIGARPLAGKSLSGVANAGVEALARSLALEFAPTRVNVVSPGLIDTPAYGGLPEDKKNALYAEAEARLPVGRVGQAADIGALIIQCMTNPFMTGSILVADGGHLLV